jgi:sec-independent protein translocase protein TatB
MFDVGFSELVVIALVALIVIGPERLPKVARTVGALLGRLQRYVNDVKADINREIQLDELRKLQQEMTDQVTNLGASVTHEVREVESSVNTAIAPLTEIAAVPEPTLETAQTADVKEVQTTGPEAVAAEVQKS